MNINTAPSNIRKLYLLNFLAGLIFWYPIEKLFMLAIHIDPFGISVNAAVYLAVLILLDIPAGILADKWSRKYTIILSLTALVLSSFFGGISNNFWGYLSMTVLIGVHVVLANGTLQAIMYDTLQEKKLEKAYDKFQGKAFGLYLIGFGISSLAGGYLSAWFGYRAAYFVTAIAAVFALGITLLLTEPKIHKHISDNKLIVHLKQSIRNIFVTKLLLQLTLLAVSAGILRNSQNEFGGLLFIALGFNVIQIGFATAVKWLFSASGQFVAFKFGRKSLRVVPIFFMIFLLFSLIHTVLSILFFFMASFLYSVIENQSEAAIQDNTPSALRATTLSAITFAQNLLLIPLSLLFGWITRQSNVFDAYLMIAIVGCIYMGIWIVLGRRQISKIYNAASSIHLPSIKEELS